MYWSIKHYFILFNFIRVKLIRNVYYYIHLKVQLIQKVGSYLQLNLKYRVYYLVYKENQTFNRSTRLKFNLILLL